MGMSRLEEALLPFEKKLRAQERLRRLLGVKEVERPTYERYIIGDIERFDARNTAFQLLRSDGATGAGFRERFRARTGYDSTAPLPYDELEPEDRIGQSCLEKA